MGSPLEIGGGKKQVASLSDSLRAVVANLLCLL